MKWGRALAVLVFFFPLPALAQVVISEVMYNPQGSDSGREWVELYNEGSSTVPLVGGSGKGSWRINDGSNHTIIDPAGGTGRGSLAIPGGGYLVIASDPTEFISGEYAGGTYPVAKSSLALNNNGTTISLLDGNGSTVDTVSYTPSQGGGDDGSSLQRQADGSWIAALPTPGGANSTIPYVAPVVSDDSAATNSPQTASTTDQTTGQPETPQSVSSYVAPPAPSLYADAGADRTVIVGADVEFDASAYDRTQTMLDPSVTRFMWNFGDGGTAEGDSVLHHFSYPGTYAVTLDIANNKNAAEAQVAVDAQPAALVFSLLPDGGADIENLSGHELDLTGWIVRQDEGPFAAQFILPENSKVLANSAMRVSAQTLGFRASSSTALEYPNGETALVVGQGSVATTTQINGPVVVVPPTPEPRRSIEQVRSVSEPAKETSTSTDRSVSADQADTASPEEDEMVAPEPTSTVLQAASASSARGSSYLWWTGIGALALAAAATLVAASQFRKREWDIVEDTSE